MFLSVRLLENSTETLHGNGAETMTIKIGKLEIVINYQKREKSARQTVEQAVQFLDQPERPKTYHFYVDR